MKVVGIYTGNFQPPHRGNLNAFNYLKKITGENTFIGARKQRRSEEEPLPFSDRKQIWAKHGVPSDKIVEVSNIYMPKEILKNFDPKSTSLVLLKEKDGINEMTNRVSGIPNYFLPYRGNESSLKPYMEHSYIFEYPDTIMEMDGTQLTNKSIRRIISSPKINPEQKKAMLKKVMGWYDIGLFERMEKVMGSPQAHMNINESAIDVIREMIMDELSNTPFPTMGLDKDKKDDDQGLDLFGLDDPTKTIGMDQTEKDKQDRQDAELRKKKLDTLNKGIDATKLQSKYFEKQGLVNKQDLKDKIELRNQLKIGGI